MTLNGLRTGLTMPHVIGVGAVVLMLAVGDGARHTVNEQIRAMAATCFMVLSGPAPRRRAHGLRHQADDHPGGRGRPDEAFSLDGVAPVQTQTAQLAYGRATGARRSMG